MTGTLVLSKRHEKKVIVMPEAPADKTTCDRTYFLLSAVLSHQALFQVSHKYLVLLETQNSVFEAQ